MKNSHSYAMTLDAKQWLTWWKSECSLKVSYAKSRFDIAFYETCFFELQKLHDKRMK